MNGTRGNSRPEPLPSNGAPGNRFDNGALSLYATIKSPPRNDPCAIIRLLSTTCMNINTAFSVDFPEAAQRDGSPHGDRTRRAKKRRTSRSWEKWKSCERRERRRRTREGERNRGRARKKEREKERRGLLTHGIKESASEWVKVSWNTEAVLWNWSAACIISDNLYSLRRSVLHGRPPGIVRISRVNQ